MSRKKPVAQHVADGTYRPSVHGPKPEELPTVPAARPSEPKLDAAARTAWNELVGLVEGRLRPEDGPQLEQCAVWLAKWRLIVASLDKAKPGTLPFTRLVSAASTASKNFDRIAKKFGLAPLDREALNLPAGDTNGGVLRW